MEAKKTTTREKLTKKMEAIITGICGEPCEIVLLTNGKLYLSLIFDGNKSAACETLRSFFGDKFDTYEFDAELDATYAGINLQ